jgi:hypothetical protein
VGRSGYQLGSCRARLWGQPRPPRHDYSAEAGTLGSRLSRRGISEVAQAAQSGCDPHGLRFSPSNIPDLPVTLMALVRVKHNDSDLTWPATEGSRTFDRDPESERAALVVLRLALRVLPVMCIHRHYQRALLASNLKSQLELGALYPEPRQTSCWVSRGGSTRSRFRCRVRVGFTPWVPQQVHKSDASAVTFVDQHDPI